MEKEIWKDIEGYEGKYMVSSMGRIKSLSYNKTGKEKLLIPHENSNGYLTIRLCNLGVCKTFKLHKLIAQAFIPNPENKPCIDHINTDRTDNRVENLRWCTIVENINNPLTKDKISAAQKKRFFKKEEHPMFNKKHSQSSKNLISQKNSKPVLQIDVNTGEVIKEWTSGSEVRKILNWDVANIFRCCQGRCKSAYGYKWKYKEKAA